MREFFWCVEYFATFVEIFMCCYFCGTFIMKEKLRDNRSKITMLSIIASIVIIALNKVDLFSYLSTIIFLLLCVIMQCIVYRKKILATIGMVFAYAAILSAIDMMSAYFVAMVINANAGYLLEEQSFVRVVCILMSKCILIILVLTLNRVIAHKRTIPPSYILVMSLCSAFLLMSNLVLVYSELDKKSEELSGFTMVFFVASLVIEMIIFSLVIKIAEGYEQKKNNELIEMSNEILQKSLDETEQTFELWRQSIHDYKNNIITLTQMVEDERFEEIKAYLEEKNELMTRKMYYTKTGNSVIDAIINSKQNVAEKKNIVFVVNAKIPENTIISDIDLANILGNLIDNAIEAEEQEQQPYIEVTVKQEKSFLIINTKNKYTKNLQEDLSTTKRQTAFHGIGLRSVKQIVNKHDGEIQIDVTGGEFVVNIMIKNNVE